MRELRKETETFQSNIFQSLLYLIRNERTPKGDGNFFSFRMIFNIRFVHIRNERTPKGDGNIINHLNTFMY